MTPYYEQDGITIYHGDCREILPSLVGIDVVITDPPYAMSMGDGGLAAKRSYVAGIRAGALHEGFDISILSGFQNWMCFCAKDQLPSLIGLAQEGGRWMLISWNKPNPTPFVNGNYLPDTEYVVHCFKSADSLYGRYEDRSRYIVHPAEQNGYMGHPTVKPERVMLRLVCVGSAPGQLICDPFMGSGTTLVAAKRLGRKAIGIEIEERYCEIAAERLRQGALPLALSGR